MAKSLDPQKALSYLQPGGPLSLQIAGFETRSEQQEMMLQVIEAFNDGKAALIEAGTGTGKSIAYLIPAILWAVTNGERTVISTNTINLQEQLLLKDIPLLLKTLGVELQATLVKGMGNYLCLRHFEETMEELRVLDTKEMEEMERVSVWQSQTQSGSLGELPFIPSQGVKERIQADADTCSHRRCSQFQNCYFFQDRKKAEDANILIVNHHLLFADLAKRFENIDGKNKGILPEYTRVIIDEAHNIEHTATEFFADKITQKGLMRTLARLSSEKDGKLTKLKQLVSHHYPAKKYARDRQVCSVLELLTINLPATRRELIQSLGEHFANYRFFLDTIFPMKSESYEKKIRILAKHFSHPVWKEQILPDLLNLDNLLKRYLADITSLQKEIEGLSNENFRKAADNMLFDITGFAGKLGTAHAMIMNFARGEIVEDKVRWIEQVQSPYHINVRLVDAPVDIAKMMVDTLFKPFPSVVLCSATLSTNKRFEYIKKRLGLNDEFFPNREKVERIYESPFNYTKQAMLVIPNDIPEPSAENFTEEACRRIHDLVEASHGNALVLFTSYKMLMDCFKNLQQPLGKRYSLLKQGDESRHSLLEKCRETERSVLFATHSFWEGVDIAGDALRCVIITKLPFQVPSEPIIEARCEAIEREGKSAFQEYSLPMAVVKFKQGFGRLIRKKNDRGCIVCLDRRLFSKSYGSYFLNSLPSCQKVCASTPEILKAMQTFYRKTYYLTKS